MRGALHKRSEVFDGVCVNLAANVLKRMVNYFVLVTLVEPNVRLERIG
jgi:hypothetical protein